MSLDISLCDIFDRDRVQIVFNTHEYLSLSFFQWVRASNVKQVWCVICVFESLQHLSASLRFLSIGHYQFYHAMENEFDFVFFCCCDFISICWVWCVISVFESLQHSNFFSIDDHQVHHCNENKFVFVTLRRTWITNMIVIFFLYFLIMSLSCFDFILDNGLITIFMDSLYFFLFKKLFILFFLAFSY